MIIEILFQRMETFCHRNLREPDSRTTWCLKTEQSIASFIISFHQVCMAKISSVSHWLLELVPKYEIVCRLRLEYDAWCLLPSPFHKLRC